MIDDIMVGGPNSVYCKDCVTLPQKQFQVSNILGNALRLVFHDAGEVDIRTRDVFGSDGCLSPTAPNSGLQESTTVAMTIIESFWQKYCDKISRADFWVLFGKIAAESGLTTGRFASYSGVNPIKVAGQNSRPILNIPFQYGRKDNKVCDGGQNRLPEHQPRLSEFTKTFVQQMGMTVHDGVTLNGAHTVGHVHTEFSGFGFQETLTARQNDPLINAWDETPFLFDNQYYDSLAGEFWLNNPAGGFNNPIANSGANFWAVQTAPGIQQPIPLCSIKTLANPNPTCGEDGNNFICVYNGVQYTTPLSNPFFTQAPANSADPANPCNCAQFFAKPSNPYPANCMMGGHSKTIMLNADMVQAFPMTLTGALNNHQGDIGELCSPIVAAQSDPLIFPQPNFVPSPNLGNIQPFMGFGCVENSIGHVANDPNNVQVVRSTVLPVDPNAPSVSLWAQVQSYMSGGIANTCLNGVSVYDPTLNTYAGSIKLPKSDYVGQNTHSVPKEISVNCIQATPANGAGRDLFYRDFEKAWVKMVSVGYTIDYVAVGPSKKLGNLKSIILSNNAAIGVGSSTCLAAEYGGPARCY